MWTWAKEIILSKLVVQLAYMAANFGSATVVSFLVKDKVQVALGQVFMNATLQPGAQDFLNKYLHTIIAGGVMVGGEIGLHFFHDKFFLPKVIVPNTIQGELQK